MSIFLFVFRLLEDRVTRLHGQLQRHQQHLMASADPGTVDRKVLDDLYEDIHWLILVSGVCHLTRHLSRTQQLNLWEVSLLSGIISCWMMEIFPAFKFLEKLGMLLFFVSLKRFGTF